MAAVESAESARPLAVWTTCHPWIQTVVAELQPDDIDVMFLDLEDEAAVAEVLPRATTIVCLRLSADHARLLTRCKLVMHNGVGYDGIALDVLKGMGIPVALTPAMTPEGVAEHVFMLLLALSKQLPAVQESMRSGEWNMFGWRQGSHNVAYKTLGIVGLGRIGKRVAHLASAFGCRVLATDILYAPNGPDPVPTAMVDEYGVESVTWDQLLAESDLLTVHVPLTDRTHKMFGAAEFAAMKPGTLFVNASRGPVCDLDALADAVASGHLGGAGVDVFDPEPPPADHPILQISNVICTPHVASGTVERQYAINRAQFENTARVLRGDPANNLLPGYG